jgi:hypothetical protein
MAEGGFGRAPVTEQDEALFVTRGLLGRLSAAAWFPVNRRRSLQALVAEASWRDGKTIRV